MALAPATGARAQDFEQAAASRLAMIDDLQGALGRFTAAADAARLAGRCEDRHRIINGFERLYSNVIRAVATSDRFPPGTLAAEIAAWEDVKARGCPPPGLEETAPLIATPAPATAALPAPPPWITDSLATQDQWRREIVAEGDGGFEGDGSQEGWRPLTAEEQRSVAEHQAELLRQEIERLEFEQRFDLQQTAAAGRAALAAGDCPGRDAAAAALREKVNQIQSEFSSWNEADLAEALEAARELEAAPCPPPGAEPETVGTTGTDPAPTGLGVIGGAGLQLVIDSQVWCDYGPTLPRTLTPGTPGDDPRDGPGDDDPGADNPGDDPRDGPPPRPDVPETSDERTPAQQAAYLQWYNEAAEYWAGQADSGEGGDFHYGPVITPVPRDEDDDPRDGPEDDQDDPRDAPTIELIVKATNAAQTGEGQTAVGRQQIRLFPDSVQNVALPSAGGDRPQTDASADPIGCTTDEEGNCTIRIQPEDLCQHCGFDVEPGAEVCPTCDSEGPLEAYHVTIPVQELNGWVVEVSGPAGVALLQDASTGGHVVSTLEADGRTFVGILGNQSETEYIEAMLGMMLEQGHILGFEENFCRDKQPGPPFQEPMMRGSGAWGQAHDDQWAIKRVGLTSESDSAWNLLGANPRPVTVAVIDTGLDWNHLDFSWDNIWENPGEIPGNGVDDDGNGYVDDVIGWDFMENTNRPWDHDGHGTLVAGIIAADGSNGEGVAGINPHARIMVLRALNAFGHTRASYIAEAIVYAADNGARVINLSVGGPQLTQVEAAAIAHARRLGAVVVVAAGNEGVNVAEFGTAGADGVITVGATHLDDGHPAFSNWGPGVDIAAPGVDVLSLRARRTDTMLGIRDVPYEAGSAYVGADRRYYRISGTSFSAPIVAGVASLILSARPELTGQQVESILVQSAQDIQTPGIDQYSGAGMVDARAALAMDPAFRIDASITGVEVVQGDAGPVVRVMGAAGADQYASARLEIGRGENPATFTPITEIGPVSGVLGDIPAAAFQGAPVWTIRLVVAHAGGRTREARYVLDVGG